ncbi:MAG: flagellar biosynthesis protein FlhB [Sedimentisphaerales bacterium]|nr:flagellar biosynthesis protein FlhB [Sedimentisphaerales bacterium]
MPEQPAAEKTEQPTPRKLRKAKEKGQAPQSQEMASIATLLVLIASIGLMGPKLLRWFETEIKDGMSCENSVFADPNTFLGFIGTKLIDSIILISPVLAALLASSILAGAAVSGLNFSPKALGLKFDQLNPVAGFQKLINGRSMIRLLVSILKLLFISLIAWFYVQSKLDTLAGLRWAWSGQILTIISKIIFGLLIRIGIALLVIALADVMYQKWKHIQDLKMTRQEVKQDHKETEGSPEVKRRIRTIQYQMTLKRTLQEVPKATVVLVNPTHVAVAIRYDAKTMDAPIMVAKGADYMAEKIREIARAYGVPIIQRPELARTIYSTVKPGEPIPEHLYVTVAQVLAVIYRLRRRKK